MSQIADCYNALSQIDTTLTTTENVLFELQMEITHLIDENINVPNERMESWREALISARNSIIGLLKPF